MPISYRIDPGLGVVFTSATGVLSDDELLAHKRRLMDDPEFRPGMAELSDVREVERLDVTPQGIARFASRDQADAARIQDFKLAIVAQKDIVYGMARMYEMSTSENPHRVNVFRDMDEAMEWLGIRQGS